MWYIPYKIPSGFGCGFIFNFLTQFVAQFITDSMCCLWNIKQPSSKNSKIRHNSKLQLIVIIFLLETSLIYKIHDKLLSLKLMSKTQECILLKDYANLLFRLNRILPMFSTSVPGYTCGIKDFTKGFVCITSLYSKKVVSIFFNWALFKTCKLRWNSVMCVEKSRVYVQSTSMFFLGYFFC